MNPYTVQDVAPEGEYHYHAPFVVVTHRVKDIGLVGWNNNRWTHQDKAPHGTTSASAAVVLKTTTRDSSQTAWKQAFDPESCKYYFYNRIKGVTSWEAPHEPFTADETVEYYVRSGIATPYVHATCKDENQLSQYESRAELAQGCSPALLHEQGDGSTLSTHADRGASMTPAHVRFSPSKKGDLAKDVERYWVLRYSLFSRWNLGVVLNEKSLFSVTPEVIAKHHAAMLWGGTSVLDAFCGCGGNTIHLAGAFEQVFACEIDDEQLCMAKRNCEVYGVADGVTWMHGDIFEAQVDPVDAVFLSPPWGGPGVDGSTAFDATVPIEDLGRSIKECIAFACSCLSTYSLTQQKPGNADTPNVAVYLPRNTSITTLEDALDVRGFQIVPLCLERNILNEKLKSATLYCRVTSL